MVSGILVLGGLAALAGLVIWLVVRRVRGEEPVQARGGETRALRQFFQYAALYGLLLVACIGLSGLLGQLLDRATLVRDSSALALDLTFTIVGVPLYAVLAAWTRRGVRRDSTERTGLAWAAYTTAACLTALAFTMTSFYAVLAWVTGWKAFEARALATFLVWGTVWAAHWWLDTRLTPPEHSLEHRLIASLAALATSAAGLAVLVAGLVKAVTGIGSTAALVAAGYLPEADRTLLRGGILLLVGVPVWLLYWWRTASRSAHGPLWLTYVLLAGVAGGLVTAVVGASIAGYDVLVWLLGQPWSTDAAVHFRGLPAGCGAAVAGAVVWWYHHGVLREGGRRERSEVDRVYEYLMAATGLVAASIGVTMVIVALVEAMTTSVALVGTAAVNTLLLAVTIMCVGVPVWAVFWRRAQHAAATDGAHELTSPTRRVYLIVLFGVAGAAAVIALLAAVYVVAQDALTASVGAATLRGMRVPLGILVSSGIVSGYHAFVYRSDRHVLRSLPQQALPRGPRYVLLVGPTDSQVLHAVAHETGGQVQVWSTDDGPAWTAEGVLAALAALGPPPQEAVVVCEPDGVHAFAVHRH